MKISFSSRINRSSLGLAVSAAVLIAMSSCTYEEAHRGTIGAAGGAIAGGILGGGEGAAAGAVIGGLIGAGTARDRYTDYGYGHRYYYPPPPPRGYYGYYH